MLIEELEKQNGFDKEVVKPRAYKRRKGIGATLGTSGLALGAVALISALI